MMKIFQEAGGKVDFTQEELLFAAFHHDLGKLGEKGLLHYHKINLIEILKIKESISKLILIYGIYLILIEQCTY